MVGTLYVSANGSYEDQKGSSYAVPRVSAAVAGYLLENPGVTQEKVLDYLMMPETRDMTFSLGGGISNEN